MEDRISLNEVVEAIEQLKNGKSPGYDYSITPEALKYGGNFVKDRLCQICNEIFESNKAPKQFTTNLIVPLPKKGDKTLMSNYRGISLMSIAAKIYNKIILNRIREPVDAILRPNQAGFRRGRSCGDQIHVIRRLLEGANDKQIPIFITFVDFKKAFDSINREIMFSILRHYGIPEKIVNAIKTIYKNSRSAVIVEGNISEEFEVTTGVLQGDTLAPFLFIIVLDYVMRKAEADNTNDKGEHGFITNLRESVRRPATSINDLDFTDDIALLENSLEQSQLQLQYTSNRAKEVGLEVNIKKTEAMTNQAKNGTIKLDGETIKWVENFKYLGSMMLSSETDIKIRKGQAWGAFWKMKDIWKSIKISLTLKINIFKASCLSILLYGSESWIITQKLADSLNSFATNCYRIMQNIKWQDKISNETLYKNTKQEPIVQTIQRRQLRFIGHCLRRDKEEFTYQYALYTPQPRHGKRKQGRPKLLYPDYIAKLINNEVQPTTDELRKIAVERTEWSKFVVACKPRLFSAE